MFGHSVFNPLSPQGLAISNLFIFLIVVAACIFAGLPLTLAYTLPRFRHRPGQGDPPPTFGSVKVEIVYTAVPILILVVVFVFTVMTMRIAQPGGDPPPGRTQVADVTAIGHQWWWEFRYPSGAVTANIVHIPVGRRLLVALKSVDVIHSFWAPQLEGKMDAVPGQTNHMWLEADRAGVYEGACAEFCGTGHAWMRFEVIAEPRARFDAWQRALLHPPALPGTAPARAGAALFRHLTCPSCHFIARATIRPTPARPPAGASSAGGLPAVLIAPPLTHFASRAFFGGGVLSNSPANVAAWLHDPNLFKQGVHMPNLQLTDPEIRALTAYLESLR